MLKKEREIAVSNSEFDMLDFLSCPRVEACSAVNYVGGKNLKVFKGKQRSKPV